MKFVVFVLALVVATSRDARAQAFPPDGAWIEFLCDVFPMHDDVGDAAGALNERDVVGDLGAPAGMHAADASFLYLRLRVDKDPAPGGTFAPYSWGYEFDVDANFTTYEVLLLVDHTGGGQGDVLVFRNTTTTQPNDPTDPADTPPVAMFPVATHARSLAAGSTFNGDGDFWVEFAVPWTALTPLGIDRTTRVRVLAASSSSGTSLNGDFACHDDRTGAPLLDQFFTDPTTPDPVIDTDGDGFTDAQEVAAGSDPNDPNSVPESRLAGGGGCNAGGGSLGLAWLVIIGSLRSAWRRARGPRR